MDLGEDASEGGKTENAADEAPAKFRGFGPATSNPGLQGLVWPELPSRWNLKGVSPTTGPSEAT